MVEGYKQARGLRCKLSDLFLTRLAFVAHVPVLTENWLSRRFYALKFVHASTQNIGLIVLIDGSAEFLLQPDTQY